MKRFVFLILFLVASATMVSFAGDFNSGTTSSNLKFFDNSGTTLRTFTLKDTDRTLDGTGLVGTVVDGGDHWIVNVSGGVLAGSISTETGLEIYLAGGEVGISTSRSGSSIYGNGGVRICGPGMLHIDQNKNSSAINGGKGSVTIALGAVVGINSLGTGTAIEGTDIRVLASALHVNAVGGKGIICTADGDVEIGESIVTVGASDVALYHKGKGTIAISGSSVHLISGKQTALRCGYQEQVRGATSISIANSVFCALGAKHGIQGMLDGVGTAFLFDNVVGTIIGNDCGIYSSSTMLIDGASTKLVIAGNLSGKHSPDELDAVSYLGSDISTGQAICMPSLRSPPSSFFALSAGSVKLFSPGSCALLAGTNAVFAGKLEIPSEAHYGDFQTLFTWQGTIAAAETFMGRSLFQSDSIYADFDITQAFAGVVTPAAALFSLTNAKAHTGVMADMFHVSGGEVSVESSNVGIHLGGYLYSKCGYLQQVGGRISVESDRLAIADDDAVDGYTSQQSENSGIYLSGGQLSARGGWNGILMDGYVIQKGGTLEAAATGGYSAGTISQKPGLLGYALSANYAFAIEGGSFIPTAGELRFAPNTLSVHDSALVYPCNLAVSGTGAVTVSSMEPSWYGVNDLYPIGGKLRFWLPQGPATLSYKGTTYTANGTGTVVAGTNQFVPVGATLEKLSIAGDATVNSGGRATYTCTASYSDGTSKKVDAEWTLVSGASFGSMTAAGLFTAGTTTVDRTVTIQAQWRELTATKTVTIVPTVQSVIFNGNGGTPDTQTRTYTTGETYGTLPTVARVGYLFSGWWTAATGGTKVETNTVVSGATTLYARWTANTYTVTLDRQEGNGGTASVKATYGSALPKITIPTRTGYTFGGYWTTTNGLGTQYYTATGTSARNWDKTANTTLFAHWARPVLYVDASSGNDENDGLSWQTAKASIQAAIDVAEDGYLIMVNDGVYEPIKTVTASWEKSLEIVSVNGAEKTIIDGALVVDTNKPVRVAYLGTDNSGLTGWLTGKPEEPYSVLEGFTLRGGRGGPYAYVGAGALGGILRRCIITDNYSKMASGGGYSGGGVAYAVCESCTISKNQSGYLGGGAFNSSLFDCTIENNEAEYAGGGTAACWLKRCVVRNNRAREYGGAQLYGLSEDCLIDGNEAKLGGGALYSGYFSRCTVVNNRTDGYGGGAIHSTLHSTILWNNTASESNNNWSVCYGTYNDTSPLIAGPGNISVDPQFKDAAASDYRLSASSPCIDAGFGPTDLSQKDLVGEVRWQGRHIDMGAYETSNSFVPTFIAGDLWVDAKNGNDTNSGTSRNAALASIGAAVDKALNGASIHVLPGTYAPFTLDGHTLALQSTDGPETTIIDGGGVAQCAWLGYDLTSVLDGFTLFNGYVPGGKGGGGAFGGTLRGCILRGNTSGGGAAGAAEARLERCVLRGNTALNGRGGGAYGCDLANCLVYDNYACFAGGGIFITGQRIENCTIVGNTATETGGGVAGTGYVRNSIVWGNSAPTSPDLQECDEWHVCSPVVTPDCGNITDNPRFMDAESGNFKLSLDSPCINAGANDYVQGNTDLVGNIRIFGSAVDIGAYEQIEGVIAHLTPQTATNKRTYVLRLGTAAGSRYEIQWAAALDGAWTTLKTWTAGNDGESEVEVSVPDGSGMGFFRLVMTGAKSKT